MNIKFEDFGLGWIIDDGTHQVVFNDALTREMLSQCRHILKPDRFWLSCKLSASQDNECKIICSSGEEVAFINVSNVALVLPKQHFYPILTFLRGRILASKPPRKRMPVQFYRISNCKKC